MVVNNLFIGKIMKYIIFTFVVLFLSCSTKEEARLQQALEMAGKNRRELEKVLDHFKDDSLKLRAARFLIVNMPYYGYYTGKSLERQMEQYELFSRTGQHPASIRDSLARLYGPFSYGLLKKEKDLLTVDAAYLVENIEAAFRVWREQPWGKNVSFDDFCEYILPYRIGDEPLTRWREELYDRYNPLLDSVRLLPGSDDPLLAARALLDTFCREGNIKYTEQLASTPHTGPHVCVKWKSGTCREHTDAVVYVMRALGIPCGVDFMPLRGDNNSPHSWNFILDKEGRSHMVEIPSANPVVTSDTHLSAGKIYRQTFRIDRQKLQEEYGLSGLDIPPLFRASMPVDVTRLYAGPHCFDIVIPAGKLYRKVNKEEPVWLCLSCRRKWVPVGYGTAGKNGVAFEDLKGGVVFRLACSTESGLEMLSDPFLVDASGGGIRFFEPRKEIETVKVLFKFHFFYEYFLNRMVGGVFEGSNTAGFSRADTLYRIKDEPRRLVSVVYPRSDKKYRYVRYKGADGSHCNISEVAFYGNETDTSALRGRVIGTPGSFDGIHDYRKVFDRDPYTSFDYRYPDGGWSGLDLGRPERIARIAYSPRNSDNFIRKGDEYELFYLDREWISAGVRTAVSDSLDFQAPKGALLYLKNHTRGKDERIFEYREGKQVFW